MTTYDEYLHSIRKTHDITAREAIARLCELLKQEDGNLSKDDMYDRILKDLLVIWARATIIKNMPDELKDKERQESGIKGAEKKKELVVTTDGSVANGRQLNNGSEVPESPTEPNSNSFDWESEKQRIYESNQHDDHSSDSNDSKPIPKDLQPPILIDREALKEKEGIIKDQKVRIDKLEEMLTEQKKILDETIKSINAAVSLKKDKNVAVADSLEYKALESRLYSLEQENKDLKQIAQMQMKQNPTDTFKPASEINEQALEIQFPAKEIGTFFMDCRNAKQFMFLKIADGKVVTWESDTKRGARH